MLQESKARQRFFENSIVTTRKVRENASERSDRAGNGNAFLVKPDVTSYDHSIHMFF
jgi:hypothetical protein